MPTPPITETDLHPLLDTTFLQGVTHFVETDSTNTQALSLLESSLPDALQPDSHPSIPVPHLIYAETQTSGRGRGANAWWSATGSLTFSLMIDAEQLGLSNQQQMLIPLLTGLAILGTSEGRVSRRLDANATKNRPALLALKWPNDVYLAGKKLAGILCEVPATHPRHCVIGVGFNVNNSFADAPEEIRNRAISLLDQSDQTHDRLKILKTFLDHLETLLKQCAAGVPVLDAWPGHCMLTGKQITLQTGATRITGRCHGISSSGALIIETAHGPQEFLGGTIAAWR
jgi:BirA family biotin operon repressor/biotin-[acetyl-CoA-carboxylase] ligase